MRRLQLPVATWIDLGAVGALTLLAVGIPLLGASLGEWIVLAAVGAALCIPSRSR